MADYAIANRVVFPTRLDVGAVAGDGRYFTEANITAWLLGLMVNASYVSSGLTVPASSGSLVLAVALGVGYINGYRVTVPAPVNVTCTNTATNYIYLALQRTATKVSDAVFTVNTTGVAPADSVLIATATAAGGVITATTDERVFTLINAAQGKIAAITATGTWPVPAGCTSIVAEMWGGGAGGSGGAGGGGSKGGGGGAGGGAGAYQKRTIPVVPLSNITVHIGAGGAGSSGGVLNSGTSAGTNGEDTWVKTTAFKAAGGVGGGGATSGASSPASGGVAGAAGAAVISSSAFGVSGQAGTAGGDGGVSAGTSGAGASVGLGTPYTTPTGAGAAGAPNGGAASGYSAGGGGGLGGANPNGTGGNGGAGSGGLILIHY